MRKVLFSLFTFYLLLFTFSAFADDRPLGEVTVQAKEDEGPGGAEPLYDSVAFTTVITAKELEGRRVNLSEILQEAGGVQIRRYGGLDDFATVSIRGSTSEQVAVYLDGILLNQAVGRGVNISTVPADQIERIEIYKGTAPARFGSSAIGGVVNIVTKKPISGRKTRLIQSFGSFKSYEGTLIHSHHLAPFSYQVGYTYGRSSGDFSFLNDNGTPFNFADDRTEARRNNEFARNNLLMKMEYRSPTIPGLSVALQNQFFREDRGVPGLATLTSEIADLSTTREAVSLEISKKNLLPDFHLSLNPFFQYQKEQFSDPAGEIGLGVQDNDDDSYQYGAALRGEWLVGDHQRWNLHLEYRGEQFLPKDFSSPLPEEKSVRNSVGVSLEDEIVLFGERLTLNPSLRTEQIFNNLAGSAPSGRHPVSGKIGVKYRPISSVTLKTNFSRSYRIPNFTELFGDRGAIVGNPGLIPESGWNWDIGFLLQLKPVRFEVAYFLNRVDDLIQFLQTSQFTVRAENLSRGQIQGVETFLAVRPLDFLDLSVNYTFQRPKDASGLPGLAGNFLPGRPLHELNAKATLSNRWGKLFADLNFIDDNFLDTQNLLRADNRVIFNAGASARFLKRFTAGFEAKNLFNDRVADVVGFPLPGRSYYGKLEIDI
jgi:iron complex outermembrane receptor protein